MLERKHVVAAALNRRTAEWYMGELMTLASLGEVRISIDKKKNTCKVIVIGDIKDEECTEGRQAFTMVVENGPGQVKDITIDPLTMCIIELRPLWMKECEEDPK